MHCSNTGDGGGGSYQDKDASSRYFHIEKFHRNTLTASLSYRTLVLSELRQRKLMNATCNAN
jgi:hypothetical protein